MKDSHEKFDFFRLLILSCVVWKSTLYRAYTFSFRFDYRGQYHTICNLVLQSKSGILNWNLAKVYHTEFHFLIDVYAVAVVEERDANVNSVDKLYDRDVDRC